MGNGEDCGIQFNEQRDLPRDHHRSLTLALIRLTLWRWNRVAFRCKLAEKRFNTSHQPTTSFARGQQQLQHSALRAQRSRDEIIIMAEATSYGSSACDTMRDFLRIPCPGLTGNHIQPRTVGEPRLQATWPSWFGRRFQRYLVVSI